MHIRPGCLCATQLCWPRCQQTFPRQLPACLPIPELPVTRAALIHHAVDPGQASAEGETGKIDGKTMHRLADSMVASGLAEDYELHSDAGGVVKAILRPGFAVSDDERSKVPLPQPWAVLLSSPGPHCLMGLSCQLMRWPSTSTWLHAFPLLIPGATRDKRLKQPMANSLQCCQWTVAHAPCTCKFFPLQPFPFLTDLKYRRRCRRPLHASSSGPQQ